MTNFQLTVLILIVGNAVMNLFFHLKIISLLKKKQSSSVIHSDLEKQENHEYDLQYRLENFQKMKFSNIQPKSRLTKP